MLCLSACEGYAEVHACFLDDAIGGVALCESLYNDGYACWLYDNDAGELVVCATAACLDCARIDDCPETLPVVDDGERSAAFWRRALAPAK